MVNINIPYSVVIPIFNEAHNIKPLYERLKAVLDRLNSRYEILFVDDGSADGSFEILKEIALLDGTVRVIGFARNFGQHKAVVAGILEARGNYIITLDADLQNPPEEIPKLIKKMKEDFDMVSGYRKMRRDSLTRRFFSILANMTMSVITGHRMRDYGCMLRIFKRDTAKCLAAEFIKTEGYITMLVAKVTRNVAEIEVNHNERYSGRSKYNIRKLASVFLKVFSYYGLRETDKPLFKIARRVENAREVAVSA